MKALSIEPIESEEAVYNRMRADIERIRSTSSRQTHESIWMTNIAYVLGYKGISYNAQTRAFDPVARVGRVDGGSKVRVNKILPNLQNRAARLAKNPPKYDVIPESNANDDKEAARLGVQVLAALWDKLKLNEHRIKLLMWLQQCGHAWIKISWDDGTGKIIEDPETGEPMFEGDVRADVCSAFEIFTDPMVSNNEDVYSSYLYHAKARPLDYFRTQYGEKGKLVKEEDVWLQSLQYEKRANTMSVRGEGQGAHSPVKNHAIEIAKYEAPSLKYPKGRMIIGAGGIVLEEKELPNGLIPYAKFDDIVVGGKLFSEATVTHVRPLQDYFDDIVSKRANWLRKMLAGKYVAPRGTKLAPEGMNDRSGEVLYYTPVPNAPDGGRPTAVQIPSIPGFAYSEEESIDKSFGEIMGISEVSKGQMPSASIPALGMQLLQEADDTRIGIMLQQHEFAWARVGKLVLENVQTNYKIPRKLKLAGKSGEYMTKEITGDMLMGNTDVMVVPGSTTPGSKALKRNDILNAYERGLLGDANDPKVKEKVLNLIEFGDTGDIWLKRQLDERQIRNGIKQIEEGVMPSVSPYDNHALWIEELNMYRLGDKFDTLSDAQKNVVEELMQAHADEIIKLTQPPTPPPEMGGEPLPVDLMGGEALM